MSWIITDLLLALFGLVASIFIVLTIVGVGWYLVWKFFLSRFKFVRELLGTGDNKSETAAEIKQAKTKSHRKSRLD